MLPLAIHQPKLQPGPGVLLRQPPEHGDLLGAGVALGPGDEDEPLVLPLQGGGLGHDVLRPRRGLQGFDASFLQMLHELNHPVLERLLGLPSIHVKNLEVRNLAILVRREEDDLRDGLRRFAKSTQHLVVARALHVDRPDQHAVLELAVLDVLAERFDLGNHLLARATVGVVRKKDPDTVVPRQVLRGEALVQDPDVLVFPEGLLHVHLYVPVVHHVPLHPLLPLVGLELLLLVSHHVLPEVPVVIVVLALLRILQHLVGDLQLPELVLGVGVVGILVRVQLQRSPPEAGLELAFVDISWYVENLVVVLGSGGQGRKQEARQAAHGGGERRPRGGPTQKA
mmetsp:Transcript_48512/g.128283  ORF Transcript_48512/g.128283 Transcript_48512/m.128283 type:complete len:340 (+) Transcript_48512:674-1693(+)